MRQRSAHSRRESDGGKDPLSHAVGGRHLHDDYHVGYVNAAEVREVANALRDVDRTWLRRRLDAIDDPNYRAHTRRRRFRVLLGQLRRCPRILRARGDRRTHGHLYCHLTQGQMH